MIAVDIHHQAAAVLLGSNQQVVVCERNIVASKLSISVSHRGPALTLPIIDPRLSIT